MSDEYTPRIKQRFREEILPALQQELGLSNPMQVPRLEKIVVNMGIGDAVKDGRLLEAAVPADSPTALRLSGTPGASWRSPR